MYRNPSCVGYSNEGVKLSLAAVLLTISLTHRCLEFVERSVLGETGTLLNKYLQAHLEKVLSSSIPSV